MNIKILPIIAAILLCPLALNATPNVGKHRFSQHRSSGSFKSFDNGGQETTRVFSSEGSAKHTTTTETLTKSSTLSTALTGNGTTNEDLIFGGRDLICDCSTCVQHLYDLTDEDLNFADISVTTATYWDIQIRKCGIQLTKLTTEKEELTKKVESVDSLISILTKEKNSAVTDLEKCRDKNAFISTDFANITAEVNNVKKKLQVTLDDSAKLKTQWIATTADLQKWKAKSDSLEIDLKRISDSNALLTITVNEYSTTITNLRSTINETTVRNNKCVSDSNEWKRKWEAESAKVTQNEKRIKELEATNDDLTSRITKLTNDLTSCRNGSKQNDIDINKLKDTVTNLTKQSSKCTVDLGSCNVVLTRVTDEFNADKLHDVEVEKLRAKIDLQLSECVNRKKDIEQNLETERKAVDKCKAEVTTIRNDCSKRYQKYDDDITELKSNYKNATDKCEASLKSERDNSANSRTDNINLKNRITDLKTKLSVSNKNSDDWQKQSKFCEDDSINLKKSIENLQGNVADANKHLSTCVTNGNSLQSDLTSCKSKRDTCVDDLDRSKKKLVDNELAIGNLNNNVSLLESAKKSCQTELSKLRCDVDEFLKSTKAAQEKANNAALEVLNNLDTNKKLLGNFVDSHDTTCRV